MSGPIAKLWNVIKLIRAGRFVPDAARADRHFKAPEAVPMAVQFQRTMGFSLHDLEGKLSGFQLNELGVIAEVVAPALASAGDEEEVQLGDATQLHSPTSLVDEEEVESLGSDKEEASSSSDDEPSTGQPNEVLAPIVDEREATRLAAEVSGEASRVTTRRLKVIPEAANTEEVYRHAVRLTVHFGSMRGSEFLGCGRPKLMLHKQTFEDVADMFPLCRDCFALD